MILNVTLAANGYRRAASLFLFRATLPCIMAIALFPVIVVAQDQPSALLTVAETSNFQSTATYQDVIEYCEALSSSSALARLSSMGETSEGRKIPLLILADPPIQSSTEATTDSRPVFFIMANIHAGEVCGKESSLILARKLLAEKSPLLKQLILVIAPIYNVDGNERFATTNRPGQIGPANGMGQRPNAMGLDLNRDHMKLESPEARSLARFMSDWQPIVAMDLHTTDGSFHRFGLTYDSPRHPATNANLLKYGRDIYLPAISKSLTDQHELMTFFYGNFDRNHANWLSYPAAPRYSTHYFGLRNCLGILSEAYAYSSFKERVIATEQFVRATLQQTASERDTIQRLVKNAQADASHAQRLAIRATEVPLPGTFMVPAWEEEVAGRGRQFTDADKPTEYTVRYHGDTSPSLEVDVPSAYVVPADQQAAIANLKQHGVAIQILSEAKTETVTQYAISDYDQAAREFQGHRLVSNVSVETSSSEQNLPSGTVIVTTDQPLAALIVNLLEPQAADGLTAWNFFDQELKSGRYPVLRIERR